LRSGEEQAYRNSCERSELLLSWNEAAALIARRVVCSRASGHRLMLVARLRDLGMLAGALVGAELKTIFGGEQRVAAFDAVGEGVASHARELFKLAAPSTLSRERQLVARIAVQPDMDKGRVLSKPRLKRGAFRAAVRPAVAAKFHARGLSPETGDRA
jgi:hypothetical protein